MESEKLTLDICFKYPNATIIFNRDNEKWFGIESFVYNYYSINEPTFSINDCQLQLRPLSSLTEEEKKVIQKWLPDDLDLKDVELYELLEIILDVVSFEDLIKFYDYLRSINIDIDGLQERGIAEYE